MSDCSTIHSYHGSQPGGRQWHISVQRSWCNSQNREVLTCRSSSALCRSLCCKFQAQKPTPRVQASRLPRRKGAIWRLFSRGDDKWRLVASHSFSKHADEEESFSVESALQTSPAQDCPLTILMESKPCFLVTKQNVLSLPTRDTCAGCLIRLGTLGWFTSVAWSTGTLGSVFFTTLGQSGLLRLLRRNQDWKTQTGAVRSLARSSAWGS